MFDFDCPDCGRHYEYSAQIVQSGGHARSGIPLVFECVCGEEIQEDELWRTMAQPEIVFERQQDLHKWQEKEYKNIKPIETHYKGYRFRSRLEARWAVFFETLRTKWIYEPEGFELGNGIRYLPDFFLPEILGGVYAEVKPDGGDFSKATILAKETGGVVWMCEGMPGLNMEDFMLDSEGQNISHPNPYFLIQNFGHDLIDKAINAARSARFEHN